MTSEDQNHSSHARKGNNIFIIGMAGSGKSTVGWMLARQLKIGFIDLDDWIEKREEHKISEIFDNGGEKHFRSVETKALESLSQIKRHVIALGGGAVLTDKNWQIMSGVGIVVWLDCPVTEIARRMLADSEQLDQRPLLSEISGITDPVEKRRVLEERLSAIYGQRKSFYEQADIVVNEQFSTPEHCARRIMSVVEKSLNQRSRSNPETRRDRPQDNVSTETSP